MSRLMGPRDLLTHRPQTARQLRDQALAADALAEQLQLLMGVVNDWRTQLVDRLSGAGWGTEQITAAADALAGAGDDPTTLIDVLAGLAQACQDAIAVGAEAAAKKATGAADAFQREQGLGDGSGMGSAGTPAEDVAWVAQALPDCDASHPALAGIATLAKLTEAGDSRAAALVYRNQDSEVGDGVLGHELLAWYLREGRLGSGEEQDREELIAATDSLLAGSVLAAPVTVYRGDDLTWSGAEPGDLTGVEITDLAHLSTTTDPVHARHWSPTVVHLLVPAGTPAVVITGPESHSGPDGGQDAGAEPGRRAAEVLLGRGLTYRITSEQVTRDDAGRVTGRDVHAQLLPPGALLPPDVGPGVQLDGLRALTAATARMADRPAGGIDLDSALALAVDPGWDAERAEAAARAMRGYRGATWREIHAWVRAQATGDTTVSSTISGRWTWDGPVEHQHIPDLVDLVDEVLTAAPLAAPVLLWRGTSGVLALGEQWRDEGDLTGVTWLEASYQSASAAKRVAESFAASGPDGLLLRLHVPAGIGAIRLSSWPTRERHTLEAELLLQRGLRMTVASDRTEPWGDPGWGYTRRVLDVQVQP